MDAMPDLMEIPFLFLAYLDRMTKANFWQKIKEINLAVWWGLKVKYQRKYFFTLSLIASPFLSNKMAHFQGFDTKIVQIRPLEAEIQLLEFFGCTRITQNLSAHKMGAGGFRHPKFGTFWFFMGVNTHTKNYVNLRWCCQYGVYTWCGMPKLHHHPSS